MARRLQRRARQLALVGVGIPVAAWALEQAARRVEGRGGDAAWWSRRLRDGADWLGRQGRGPLAERLRRPTTTVTRRRDPER